MIGRVRWKTVTLWILNSKDKTTHQRQNLIDLQSQLWKVICLSEVSLSSTKISRDSWWLTIIEGVHLLRGSMMRRSPWILMTKVKIRWIAQILLEEWQYCRKVKLSSQTSYNRRVVLSKSSKKREVRLKSQEFSTILLNKRVPKTLKLEAVNK
jgi:hypothetical protein